MENDYRGESAELSAILKDIERYKSQDVALTKRRKLSKDEVDYEVIEAAYILGLVPYLSRFPSALSGGQRQRVALGRAIVRHPKLFLMDEPLSNLDAKLRVQMRGEISRIAKAVGATTIYVTHDQTEAMTLADRIVVMKDGCIQQIAKPMDAFKDPDNVFVAGFIGSPAMNFVKGKAENGVFHFPNGYDLPLSEKDKKMLSAYEGKEITLGIRPENVILAGDPRAPKDGKPLRINVESTELLGTEFIYYSKIGDAPFLVKSTLFKGGGLNDVYPDEGALYFFDEEGKRIRA
jgi:multiple sugar transport system ATP-binding protein